MTLRTFSSGGGVQSTAALVLSAQGVIDFPIHLFSNVGDDSEHPATLAYVNDVIKPYALVHGIEFHELHRVKRDGTKETLYGRLTNEGAVSGTVSIPVRKVLDGPPMSRSCTQDFKLRVLNKWHKAHGATNDDPAVVGIGFSTDEIQRIGKATKRDCEVVAYPLIDLGLSRNDCLRVVEKAGLPQPPKSSCWFCPMHRPSVWSEMRRDEPELFARSVELEAALSTRRGAVGKDPVYFTRYAKPLDLAIGEAQTPLFTGDGLVAGEFEECDEGVCFT